MYGEIYILGPCKMNCFYCIKNQIPSAKSQNQLEDHFSQWVNFDKFVSLCKENHIETIYLSSINTDPVLYNYIYSLTEYLRHEKFKVGIRTNIGNIYNIWSTSDKNAIGNIIDKFDNISISINSIEDELSYKIGKSKYDKHTLKTFLKRCKLVDKKVRVTITINRYNIGDLSNIINFLIPYYSIIKYMQIRKLYVYNHLKDLNMKLISDDYAYDFACNYIKTIGTQIKSFHNQEQYEIIKNNERLVVSLWDDRLDADAVQAINYFTSGEVQYSIDTNNEIVPAYENKNISK